MWRLLLILISSAMTQSPPNIKILFFIEEQQTYLPNWISTILKNIETTSKTGITLSDEILVFLSKNERETNEKFCSIMGGDSGISIILDLTWGGWHAGRTLAEMHQVPYVHLDVSIQPFVRSLDEYLNSRNASEAVLIFQNEEELDQTLYYFIEHSYLRIMVSGGLDEKSAARIRDMKPIPSQYVIFANSERMVDLYRKAVFEKLTFLHDRWNLVLLDFNKQIFTEQLNTSMSLLYPNNKLCCEYSSVPEPCTCSRTFNIHYEFFNKFLKYLSDMISKSFQKSNADFSPKTFECKTDKSNFLNETKDIFDEFLIDELINNKLFYKKDDKITYNLEMMIEFQNRTNQKELVANWTMKEGIQIQLGKDIVPTKRFFRIGIVEQIPWVFKEIDSNTGNVLLHPDGTEKWTGYCIEFIEKLANKMQFDYELVIPENGTYGRKLSPLKWDGLVGDLITGNTDIAISALVMTAEREEVIDFVAPYFEQTGILIVIRKPIRKTSLFKFMTVLRIEVWLSIVAALSTTAIMIWFLDKYSPYSARNNKNAYPYPCREFTLKESFWFALTSFTPQGGGEAPKALSGRTLVAAYWLFVVLMLATFTANLAAFLTVERMQSPVQSLEQLARQSRINYTVVKNSMTHQYFINMKFAEDTLYRMWKELTLNATSDQALYRVWDYPIKEQWGHILLAINESMPVENASVGFQQVEDHIDADFAFIHDSSEIRYEVSKNCNLTIVGEVFSDKPYAVAVQQGSHLQEEISRLILNLQKERFFESLTAKYWNNSAKGNCQNNDDTEGITLESLGGVFIATLFGLAIAMITLAGEIFYYKRKEKNVVHDMAKIKTKELSTIKPKQVTIGTTFKPVANKVPRVSYISVFPRHEFQP